MVINKKKLKLDRVFLGLVAGLVLVVLAAGEQPVQAARIKDLALIEGVRPNQLIGYGLVVGLNGTGDKSSTQFTVRSVLNMLQRLGVQLDESRIQVKNVAAVVVTTELLPFARVGSRLDVLVSSLGDATSLTGGTLLLTPLKGVDDRVYALSQGPLLVGGFQVAGDTGTAATKNHPTVGRIPQGATVEREIEYTINDLQEILITLDKPDFTTATRMAGGINQQLGGIYAQAIDAGTIKLTTPPDRMGDMVGLIAQIEEINVIPDTVAKVIVDERTGTVVMGSNVTISTVAVAHGNLSILVKESFEVSQPLPFSEGETIVVPETEIEIFEEEQQLILLDPGVTIASVVEALNAIGATPRDLIAILQSLKAAGALQAQLEII